MDQVLLSSTIAAILTLIPDADHQLLMAGLLVVLYEINIGAVWLLGRKKIAGAESGD